METTNWEAKCNAVEAELANAREHHIRVWMNQRDLIASLKREIEEKKKDSLTLDYSRTHTMVDEHDSLRVINNAVRMPVVLVDPETSRVFEVSMWRPEIRQGQSVSVVMQANVLMPTEDFDG